MSIKVLHSNLVVVKLNVCAWLRTSGDYMILALMDIVHWAVASFSKIMDIVHCIFINWLSWSRDATSDVKCTDSGLIPE